MDEIYYHNLPTETTFFFVQALVYNLPFKDSGPLQDRVMEVWLILIPHLFLKNTDRMRAEVNLTWRKWNSKKRLTQISHQKMKCGGACSTEALNILPKSKTIGKEISEVLKHCLRGICNIFAPFPPTSKTSLQRKGRNT